MMKKIIYCIGIIIISFVFIFPQTFDRIILLEKSRPNYWKCFGNIENNVYFLDDNLNIYSNVNLFRARFLEYKDNNVKINYDPRTREIELSGTTDGRDVYLNISPANFILQNGFYCFTEESINDDIRIYITANVDGINKIISFAKADSEVFYIDNSDIKDISIWLNTRWGFNSKSIILRPQLTMSDGFKTKYLDGSNKENYRSFSQLHMENDLKSIPYSDYKLFLNTIRNNTRQVDRITIRTDDERGIVYQKSRTDNIGIYGYVNDVGEINETIGFIKDMDGYMSLLNEDGNPVSSDTSIIGINGIE